MKVLLLLLLLSCLAALTLASPLPRPQERAPRLFIPRAVIDTVVNTVQGFPSALGLLNTLIPDVTKTFPCGTNGGEMCTISIENRRRRRRRGLGQLNDEGKKHYDDERESWTMK
ncbi:hypothetical protein Pmani_016033 [Petrolisthes manimaculis]|uniref:Uncharacterized protein n=1 Tax=Petrolisthes manimaculis TaxID=1843537 RepID=A0AAE1PSK9_9EUCA|nr:hypothetical protein Pmani_016033 [Petrolisthes manimaculis]